MNRLQTTLELLATMELLARTSPSKRPASFVEQPLERSSRASPVEAPHAVRHAYRGPHLEARS